MEEKHLKSTKIQIRVSEFTRNRLQVLAKRYAGGNMSAWVEHGIMNAPREYIKVSNQKQPKKNQKG